jgi:hypothetical protein
MDALFPWIRRQTFFGFLYNPSFQARNRVVTVVYNATLVGAFVLTCVAAARGNSLAFLLGSLLAGYVALLIGAHLQMDAIIADKRRSRGESVRGPDATSAILLLLCFPVSQLMSLAAVVSTLRTPSISWRGVRYRIGGPLRIQKLAEDSVLEQPAVAEEQLDLTHRS